MKKGVEVGGIRVLNGLGHLVKMIVGTSQIQDAHMEEADQDRICQGHSAT